MKTTFRKSFLHDLKKIKRNDLLLAIQDAIKQVEATTDLQQISHLNKMSGASGCYRIRIGDYRIGVEVKNDVVEFVRCLDRKDLYKYFP